MLLFGNKTKKKIKNIASIIIYTILNPLQNTFKAKSLDNTNLHLEYWSHVAMTTKVRAKGCHLGLPK